MCLGANQTAAPPRLILPRQLLPALQPTVEEPGACLLVRNPDGSTWSRLASTDAAVYRENPRDFPPLLEALAPFSASVGYVVDAGSNNGVSTWLMARAMPHATVAAIEPGLENYAMSLVNTRGLHNVIALRAALWGNSTRMRVSAPIAAKHLGSTQWGLRTKPPEELARGDQRARRGAEAAADSDVPGVSMDDLLGALGFPRIDLLKIDIEGAEAQVLNSRSADARGGRGWLQGVRFLLLEAHPHSLGAERGSRGRGYELLHGCLASMLTAGMTVVALPRREFAHLPGVHEWMYLACGALVHRDACLSVCQRWQRASASEAASVCSRVTAASEVWGRTGRPRGIKVFAAADVGL